MSAIKQVEQITPTAFDSFTSETAQTIDVHLYRDGNPGERVSHVVTLSPERALELIQELSLALGGFPTHVHIAGILGDVIENASVPA